MAVLQGQEARQAIARAKRRARLAAVPAPRSESPRLDGQGHDESADVRISHLFRRTADRLLAG